MLTKLGMSESAVRVAVHRMRKRLGPWAEKDEKLAPAAHLMERPYSTAMVVTLLSTTWLYPFAPFMLTAYTTVLSILPTLRILVHVAADQPAVAQLLFD